MSRAADLARLRKEKRRQHELRRCRTDLYYLATEYLNYKWNPDAGSGEFKGKGLTDRLHKPICNWFDKNRMAMFMLLLMARWHHKTTIVVAMIIQQYLINPNTYLFYFHAVDRLASDVVAEVGNHLMHNKKLRTLEPIGTYSEHHPDEKKRDRGFNILPHPSSKRWLKADHFELTRDPHAEGGEYRYIRFPSLLGKGAGSEVTGAHCAMAFLDDIIGKNTIEDNQVGKITGWVQDTIMPVVDDMIIRAIGTPWCPYGAYEDWKASSNWLTCTLPASTKEDLGDIDWTQQDIALTPDYDLENPIYRPEPRDPVQIKQLKILKTEMKANFAPQMMCDPSPHGEKPWGEVDEKSLMIPWKPPINRIGVSVHASGPGVVFVLSDPAPKFVGSPNKEKEKLRAGDEKDFWAIAVVKFRWRGNVMEKILLDGIASRDWTTEAGFDQVCRLMIRWRTNKAIHESYGGLNADYHVAMQRAAKRNGVAWMQWDKDGKPIKFRTNYNHASKNSRFGDLAFDAANGGFYICETCPQEFLEGDPMVKHGALLPQSRDWKNLKTGRNGLTNDDHADITSRCEDPIFDEYAPVMVHEDPTWRDWVRAEEEDGLFGDSGRSRYIQI